MKPSASDVHKNILADKKVFIIIINKRSRPNYFAEHAIVQNYVNILRFKELCNYDYLSMFIILKSVQFIIFLNTLFLVINLKLK